MIIPTKPREFHDPIPDKGREFVLKWAERIKPLLEFEAREGVLFDFTNEADHFDESYPWKAQEYRPLETPVAELRRIRTLHRFAYYGFFKPSVAEVLQQIPEELLEQTDYFLVRGPKTADDLNKSNTLSMGFHAAETILYGIVNRGGA